MGANVPGSTVAEKVCLNHIDHVRSKDIMFENDFYDRGKSIYFEPAFEEACKNLAAQRAKHNADDLKKLHDLGY